MQILLSAPRTGSSWVYDRIEASNAKCGAKLIRPSEFFGPDHPHGGSTLDKVAWLEDQRDRGIEVSFKHHINYLITDTQDLYHGWFTEFYKQHEVVVLRRRDTWSWFRSFLVQDMTNWRAAGVNQSNLVDVNSLTTASGHRPVAESITQFVNIKAQLDQVKADTTLWYEDQSDDWDTTSIRLSSLIDYDEILGRNFDMMAVQEELTRCLKN